jgi:urea carboxylase
VGNWRFRPHGARFFPTKIEMISWATWKVHHNSDRTGVRLIGPRPVGARDGTKPACTLPTSDNAYAVGHGFHRRYADPAVRTAELGGFVCPTVSCAGGRPAPPVIRFASSRFHHATGMEELSTSSR